MTLFTVGLDISYTGTGIAVLKDGKYAPGYSQVFSTTPKQGTHVERADLIAKQILQVVRDVLEPHGTVKVFIEDYAFARLTNREAMGELTGIVKHTLWKNGYPWETLPISTVRKVVTGKGNAKKDTVMYFLLKRHDLDITQNDLADAAAVALTGSFIAKSRADASEMSSYLADVREAIQSYLKSNPVGV